MAESGYLYRMFFPDGGGGGTAEVVALEDDDEDVPLMEDDVDVEDVLVESPLEGVEEAVALECSCLVVPFEVA